MTARQIFESLLVELSKVNAPSMLLQDFNYFINKAVYQYVNKRYNIYDVNQQTTDDLRVLKATAKLQPKKANSDYGNYATGAANIFGATYTVELPQDYLHMLNCLCIYQLRKNHKCYDRGNYVQFPAKRLTADAWSIVVNDFYNRPLPERPYYYIHNVNSAITNPTNWNDGTNNGTDYIIPKTSLNESKSAVESSHPRTIQLNIGNNDPIESSIVERDAGVRYGNTSKVRCEIRYGRDDSVFVLKQVFIDYIKAPQTIRLTQEQVDLTEDTSQIMEFPDYVCQEIINELVTLVMENTADPRLQSHPIVTQSIANPVQQQAPQQRG